jgi:hypothetical protein
VFRSAIASIAIHTPSRIPRIPQLVLGQFVARFSASSKYTARPARERNPVISNDSLAMSDDLSMVSESEVNPNHVAAKPGKARNSAGASLGI